MNLKNTNKMVECSKCRIGGVRSFTSNNVTSISDYKYQDQVLDSEVLEELTLSSSCTLTRTESEEEWNHKDVVEVREKLYTPVDKVFNAANKWIQENQLDAVICFNGRMDLTRAVTYACEAQKIPFLTHERTWFGDGLLLTPNANCLSIKALDDLVNKYDSLPLTSEQALYAANLIAIRFLGLNKLEWRVYNQNPESISWPTSSKKEKILVLPSSKNEFAGHPEWQSSWVDNTKAVDDYLEVFGYSSDQVVVRCHPNWAENIGQVEGNRSLSLYKNWCKDKDIFCISSEEKANTYDLIKQADIVILNGGSSAVEAGVCGKQVVCLGPSTYQSASFVNCYKSKQAMKLAVNKPSLPFDEIVRHTLRFVYLRAKRHPQFTDYVKAIETTQYEYVEGADANRLLEIFQTGSLRADDETFADTNEFENKLIEILKHQDWQALVDQISDQQEYKVGSGNLNINRKFHYRWIDGVRALFPRGDR
jgi:hypothetical protein